MASVTCRVDIGDSAAEMQRMRQWLNDHKSHVENFASYKLVASVIVVELDFADETEAHDFAAEFDGEAALNV